MDDTCMICNRPFKWKKTYKQFELGYKEVVFTTTHAKCRNLVCKLKKLKSNLLGVEWELFKLVNNFRINDINM